MTPTAARPLSIALIVDDDPGSVQMVSTALEESGTTVLVARDGPTAMELVRRVRPDVILMDAIMPGMDGFETCRALKSPPLMIDAPIIFMTGLSGTEDIRRGLAAGGVDFVSKPVVVDELIARVTVHVINAQQLSAAQAALDAGGRAIFVSTRDGHVSWGTPQALQSLNGGGLVTASGQIRDPQLLAWLKGLRGLAVSQAPTLEHPLGRLQFIGVTSAGDFILRKGGRSTEDDKARLVAVLGLTLREAEVLYWLTQGKTNKDIAEILGLSARTVNKHLEQIFKELAVENRTAAALQADRILAQS